MKNHLKVITFLFIIGFVFVACSDEPVPDCDTAEGTFICFDDKYYEVNLEKWVNTGGNINIQIARALLPGIQGDGFSSSMSLFPGSGATTPEIGTYHYVYTSAQSGNNEVIAAMQYYERINDTTTNIYNFIVDTVNATNHFEITAFDGTFVSGYMECLTVDENNPTNSKELKINFQNVELE